MVWYGKVWYGAVWYGMVWYGMVWCGMVWYGMVYHRMAWYGVLWYTEGLYGMVWYGTVWLATYPFPMTSPQSQPQTGWLLYKELHNEKAKIRVILSHDFLSVCYVLQTIVF